MFTMRTAYKGVFVSKVNFELRIRVREETFAALKQYSRQRELSMSHVSRIALNRYLREKGYLKDEH